MNKKPATRQCVGCRESFEKRNLIRVIKTPEGEIQLDVTGKSNGRGAYLCKNTECLKKARKNQGLNRSLKMAIPDEIYEQLEKELSEI
ncbi:MAG: YlxR family protein [Lachnospiraceae bacterium]|nr:YlxR family protein [Lachnospiraceae bacterium]